MIGNDLNDREAAVDWREVHEALSGIARRRAALDAEEARWLRLAEQTRIWRHFGMVSPLDYLERKLGYAPHTAQERLRVAAALGELPLTEQALANGVLGFSAVREVTRVATPATESAWVARAVGKNVREVELVLTVQAAGSSTSTRLSPRCFKPFPPWLLGARVGTASSDLSDAEAVYRTAHSRPRHPVQLLVSLRYAVSWRERRAVSVSPRIGAAILSSRYGMLR